MPKLPQADLELEREGKWFEYVPGLEVRICSIHKPAFQAAVRSRQKPQGGRMRSEGGVDDDPEEREYRRLVGEHLVTGWRGLEDDDGPVEHSTAKAVEIMLAPQYRDFRAWVLQRAADEAEYRRKLQEEAQGN